MITDLEALVVSMQNKESKPKCPGSGSQKVEGSITLDYNGVNDGLETYCKYFMYAPQAHQLEVTIEEFDVYGDDYLTIMVSPQAFGHIEKEYKFDKQPTLYVPMVLSTRYLLVNWGDKGSPDQVSKWRISILAKQGEDDSLWGHGGGYGG